jgi:CubicO group peptidase (beta-lactamase class C family)
MKNLTIVFIALLLMGCKDDSQKEISTENTEINELDQKLDSLFNSSEIVGMGVSVFDADTVLFEKGYGFSNLKDSLAYTINTTQNIASISKLVSGLTLLKAIENTGIKLSDDVNRYAPFPVRNPKFPDTPITIGQLVTHTSSLYDGDFYYKSYYLLEDNAATNPEIDAEMLVSDFIKKEDALSLSEYLKTTLTDQDSTSSAYGYTAYKPGTTYSYSNHGAGLIALIIENITGQSFKEYSKLQVIDKLSLTSSTWTDTIAATHSYLYSDRNLRVPFYGLVTAADGGYRTSTSELIVLGQELIKGYNGQGTLLNKESYHTFYEKQLDSSFFKTKNGKVQHKKNGFNLGVFLTYEALGTGHSGGDPGINTLLYFNPETNKGFSMLTNTELNERFQIDAFIKMANLLKEEIAKP